MADDKASQLNGRIRDLVVQLANETDAARQSELFQSFLRVAANFHNYSWHNQMMIWAHKPSATRAAGFRTWQKLNRYVRQGEKGIPIFAPMFFKTKEQTADGEVESMRIWFKVVYVFDVSQTGGEKLPELTQGCMGDARGLWTEATALADSLGITVDVRKMSGEALGYCEDGGKHIVIREGLDRATATAVLFHEITHSLLHFGGSEPNLRQRELEAEATAFVVASHFGLKPVSSFYLASYGVTPGMLLESLETIQRTAAPIINACIPETITDDERCSEALLAA